MNKKHQIKGIYFLLIASLFLFFSLSLASSITIQQKETGTLSNARGTGGLTFDTSGLTLYASDDWHGAKPNFVSWYSLDTPYNVSTLTYINSLNLSTLYPENFSNYTLSTAFLSRDGTKYYLTIANSTSDNTDASVHYVKYAYLHFELSTPFDFSTISLIDYKNFTKVGNKGYPMRCGMYISEDGHYLIEGVGNNIEAYTLNYSYNVSITSGLVTLPFTWSLASYPSWGSVCNLWISPDMTVRAFLERDISQGEYYTYISTSTVENGKSQAVQQLTNREGLTMAFPLSGDIYLFTQNAGTLYKYQVFNLTINNTAVPTNQTQAQETIVSQVIQPLLNLFPSYNTLTLGERLGFVMVFMIVTTLLILFPILLFVNVSLIVFLSCCFLVLLVMVLA